MDANARPHDEAANIGAAILARQHPRPLGREEGEFAMVIAIASGDAGVGRTTVVANLAVALANRGRKVLVLDADLMHADVAAQFGLEPHGDIRGVLAGERTVEEIVLAGPPGIHIIAGNFGARGPDRLGVIELAAIIWAVDSVPQRVDVLLIDMAAGAHAEALTFARAAQHVLVAVCDEPGSLRRASLLIQSLAREPAVPHFHILGSKTRSFSHGRALYEQLRQRCESLRGATLHYAGEVPDDDCIRSACRDHRTVVQAYASSLGARAFRDLAAKVDAWRRPDRLGGHLEFFVERLANADRCRRSRI
jgi:flagellar biosynthesis protein FlhG